MAQRNLHINIRLGIEQVKAAISSLRQRLNLVKSSLRAVFRTGIVAGFFFALRAGIQTLQNFKNTLVKLGGEFANLRLKATETAAIISRGGDSFSATFTEALNLSRQLSTQIGFTSTEIQEGLITAARSGLSLKESFSLTSSAMMLATSNGEEFQSTLNDLIGVSRAFNVELDDMSMFADALSAAVTSSNVSLSGLFAGLKKVAAVASTAFGETQETIADTTAALMTLNDTGMQSERAGTGLRAAMQKLLGGTARTTAAFTKYGINLFKADGASQQFLDTLLKGQQATAKTEDNLNKLKNKEYELIIANKQNSEEFKALQDEISNTDSYLNTLAKGIDTVYEQFTLAGGKLKPFSDVLTEISGKAPTEVIGRAFGIRGGAPMMQILNNVDKFQKFKRIVEESMEASQKGQSITKDMYMKFLDTVLIGWQRIKNTAMAILSTIADGLFEAIKPLLGPIQTFLDDIFRKIDSNKDKFKKMFQGVAELLKPVLAQLQIFGQSFANALDSVFTEGKTAEIPYLSMNDNDKLEMKTQKVTGTVPEKILSTLNLLGKSLVSVLNAALMKLQPSIVYLAKVFADSFENLLLAKNLIFQNIGTLIGGAMVKAFFTALIKGIPQVIESFGRITKEMGLPEKTRVGGKTFGFDIPLPFGDTLLNPIRKMRESKAIENDANKAQQSEISNKNTEGFGRLKKASQGFSLDKILASMPEVDFSKLDNAGNSLKDAMTDLKEGTDKLNENAIIFANGIYTNKKAIEHNQRVVNKLLNQR